MNKHIFVFEFLPLICYNNLVYTSAYLLVYVTSTLIVLMLCLPLGLKSNNLLELTRELRYTRNATTLFSLSILFLIGIPPFSGFIIKLLLITKFCVANNFFFVLLYFCILTVATFFYLQIIRYTRTVPSTIQDFFKNKNKIKTNKQPIINKYTIRVCIIFFIFFNFFFLLFFKDIWILLSLFML